jgi:hypothetical protein
MKAVTQVVVMALTSVMNSERCLLALQTNPTLMSSRQFLLARAILVHCHIGVSRRPANFHVSLTMPHLAKLMFGPRLGRVMTPLGLRFAQPTRVP